MAPHRSAGSITKIANDVAALSASNGRQAALRHALTAIEPLLKEPTDRLRIRLRQKVFKKSHFVGAGYQANDFESVDYLQYELAPDLPLFRGPEVSTAALDRGEYFCVFGAAQTFGRLVRRPWPLLLSEALDLPVLNLSRGGLGPELFLDPRLLQFACRSRFVILQVMSGRSVGCADYPGGRRIKHESGAGATVKRLDVLNDLWRKDPAIALQYVRRWNATYLAIYRQLRALINRPTLLLWISDRKPSDWEPECLLQDRDWGGFPHLIGREIYESVAVLFGERCEYVFVPSKEQPLSRVTGNPCPFFWSDKKLHTRFGYYPSSANNVSIAEAILPWAQVVYAGN